MTTVTTLLRGIDLDAEGRQAGSIDIEHSDNRHDDGVIPVPVVTLSGGSGPTVLLLAGTHGDEYEGQVLLHRLMRETDPSTVSGRLIILPALNLPAVRAATRVSPLDGGNLNRSYPGDERGDPTAQIAHAVVTGLLPLADLALDLHSGGANSIYLPSTFVYAGPDPETWQRKKDAAEAFGMPWSFVVPPRLEPASFSAAADEAGVLMISTELGGGGGVDPAIVRDSAAGLRRVLAGAGVLRAPDGTPTAPPTTWLDLGRGAAVRTPARGLFEPLVTLSQRVAAGDLLGYVHPVEEPERSSEPVVAHRDGIVAVLRRPPLVDFGDNLLHLADPVPEGGPA
ncbi:succinylglutamate desuccinylase/aspartoacylase family protein [Streptomyces sp. NPDC051286]|uniref:succinylglutamate desuccinylase/aspartoacylase family protein n=1 Tax=Streptomyces sp. NPDC051286 TaxID=3365647 RepID=UPI0037BB94AA